LAARDAVDAAIGSEPEIAKLIFKDLHDGIIRNPLSRGEGVEAMCPQAAKSAPFGSDPEGFFAIQENGADDRARKPLSAAIERALAILKPGQSGSV
jgi:hypothetical protein